MSDDVNHPAHYGGEDDPYEVMKVLEAWDLELAKGFAWGNLIKYTARAGKKGGESADRQKAEWYAHRLVTITATLEGRKMSAAQNAVANSGSNGAAIPPGGGGGEASGGGPEVRVGMTVNRSYLDPATGKYTAAHYWGKPEGES